MACLSVMHSEGMWKSESEISCRFFSFNIQNERSIEINNKYGQKNFQQNELLVMFSRYLLICYAIWVIYQL